MAQATAQATNQNHIYQATAQAQANIYTATAEAKINIMQATATAATFLKQRPTTITQAGNAKTISTLTPTPVKTVIGTLTPSISRTTPNNNAGNTVLTSTIVPPSANVNPSGINSNDGSAPITYYLAPTAAPNDDGVVYPAIGSFIADTPTATALPPLPTVTPLATATTVLVPTATATEVVPLPLQSGGWSNSGSPDSNQTDANPITTVGNSTDSVAPLVLLYRLLIALVIATITTFVVLPTANQGKTQLKGNRR
jgi:hypothetical protein